MKPGAVLALLTAAALAASVARAAPAAAVPNMAMGNPKAPITVIEYASVGCSHCAVWAREVFPAFRKKYVDTGKVRFELHEMETGYPTLAAAGFLTARCAGPTKYFQVVEAIYARQDDIVQEHGDSILRGIARDAGLTDARFDACLSDSAALDALDARTRKDAADHGVTGTPTFIIGGRKLDGEQSLTELDAAIAATRR